MKDPIICPTCHIEIAFKETTDGFNPKYCPFCRGNLHLNEVSISSQAIHCEPSTSSTTPYISFLPEHLPSDDQIQFTIGPYQVLKSIGKGGMGEVFLVYDTSCGRRLALKQIRTDLTKHHQLHNRFLKEARITSQLIHPSIIPIYAIHSSQEITYYTMPYIEGDTLKQVLQKARKVEKYGNKGPHASESIPSLVRIFLNICQAVAYAHSKNILHRDLKPENIIVGQYGQVIILDWGLAKLLKDQVEKIEPPIGPDVEEHPLHHLTNIGKIVGTISHMAPERAFGKPADFQTDIYSLGVILYQLLTLKTPFHRESLKSFRKNLKNEILIDPIEAAPYRDVPKSLSRVVMKCLSSLTEQRYPNVDALIHDLENFIEGRSEWFQIAELDIHKKSDWEFQENVLIAEHVAISHETEGSDWVNLMISKASFQDTIKVEAKVKVGEKGNGIGFLLSIPEAGERMHLNDGYCLWLGTDKCKSTKLLRSTVEVMNAPDVSLQRNEWINIRIEKIENNIHLYFNNTLQFSYISHLPLAGTHVGLIARDADFSLKDLTIYICSQNITVNCLSVPDAFLAHKDYATALNEYRRIGYSFPGRAEGREAMFRAGITLLEQATTSEDPSKKQHFFDLAQEEFHKLHQTPGAPLEYLGKALVYQALGDFEDEVKCFELAYRKYPRHPLLHILQEQIIYRMYENSRYHRLAAFHFILLMLIYLPSVTATTHTQKLLASLKRHWEPLPFIESESSQTLNRYVFSVKLAFWLARPYTLNEAIIELLKMEMIPAATLGNAIYCLFELKYYQLANQQLQESIEQYSKRKLSEFDDYYTWLHIIDLCHTDSLKQAIEAFLSSTIASPTFNYERTLLYLMRMAIDYRQLDELDRLYEFAITLNISESTLRHVTGYKIWNLLLQNKSEEANLLLHQYPIELLSQENTLLHFLYGCLLYLTEGKEIAIIYFSGSFDVPHPRTWALFGYYIRGKIADNDTWSQKAFSWEKQQLYRQLALFYSCTGDQKKACDYQHKVIQVVE